MAIIYNQTINPNGLKYFIDEQMNVPGTGSKFVGLDYGDSPYSGTLTTSPNNVPWNRDVTDITISVVVYKYATSTGYATHPINMWGNGPSSLDTSGFILYVFGNYQGNGADGNIGLYCGDYNGSSGGWRGHTIASGATQIAVGEYFHVAFQLGGGSGTVWRNGNKGSTISYPRPIAPSNISGYGNNNFNVYGPYQESFAVIKAGLWYNRKCSDEEIQDHYRIFKKRYPLQTR